MSSTPQVLGAPPVARRRKPREHSRLRGAELAWTVAFIAPCVAVFLAFVVYPIGYAVWIARSPSLYAELASDPNYLGAIVNTVIFVGVGVNLKMFLALVLSGFFMRREWWVKVILVAYTLPWLVAAAEACVSIHWMLISHWGLIDLVLDRFFGIEGPGWLDHRWLALTADTAAYIWKWMPFWTLIFLAARLTIPRDIYDAAAVDGATGIRRFVRVTFPLLANLYVVCTLLSTLWALGDFTTVYLVSNSGPFWSTQVMATLGYHYAFELANPPLGVAAVLTTLPVLLPIVIVLMRWLHASEERL